MSTRSSAPGSSVPLFTRPPIGHRLARVPPTLLARALWAAAGDRGIALCLHRVFDGERRPDELQPWLSMSSRRLDQLLTVLRETRPRSARLPITASFDDGYLDAVDYMRSRAPRFPEIEWIMNVCAEKSRARAGFRWDAFERSGRPRTRTELTEFLRADPDPPHENQRADLGGLADDPTYQLASVDELKALAALDNVVLGNHSNSHLVFATLDDDVLQDEIRRSTSSFEALFGATEHFTLPFGTPDVHWRRTQARVMAEATHAIIWSTEPRPYREEERRPGAVVPRFPIVGDWTVAETLGVMLTSTIRARTRSARERLRVSARAPAPANGA